LVPYFVHKAAPQSCLTEMSYARLALAISLLSKPSKELARMRQSSNKNVMM
jgi:hypothetical protein